MFPAHKGDALHKGKNSDESKPNKRHHIAEKGHKNRARWEEGTKLKMVEGHTEGWGDSMAGLRRGGRFGPADESLYAKLPARYIPKSEELTRWHGAMSRALKGLQVNGVDVGVPEAKRAAIPLTEHEIRLADEQEQGEELAKHHKWLLRQMRAQPGTAAEAKILEMYPELITMRSELLEKHMGAIGALVKIAIQGVKSKDEAELLYELDAGHIPQSIRVAADAVLRTYMEDAQADDTYTKGFLRGVLVKMGIAATDAPAFALQSNPSLWQPMLHFDKAVPGAILSSRLLTGAD